MWPFSRRGLRVLMYHKLSATRADALTVTTAQLEEQLRWLQRRDWQIVRLADVVRAIEGESPLPDRCVLITFDDGYLDTLQLAKPVLDRCGLCAAVFVPTAFVGQASTWDRDARPLMSGNDLRMLAAAGWEIGLHSHAHVSYATLDADRIERDARQNFAALGELGLTPVPALAYPYGHRPGRGTARAAMKTALQAAGVRIAFRIGNRINALPIREAFEINRLDVRGDRSFAVFRRKMNWGRLIG